jgi:hypothetical protein
LITAVQQVILGRSAQGWFDTSNPNEVSSRIAGDTVVIESGMGQKLGDLYVIMGHVRGGHEP